MFSSSGSNKNLVETPTKAYASSYFGPGMLLVEFVGVYFIVVTSLLLMCLLVVMIILYKKFVENHVIKLILLKISKLSAHLTQAIIRDKLQRLKHARYIYTSINYNVQMRARA